MKQVWMINLYTFDDDGGEPYQCAQGTYSSYGRAYAAIENSIAYMFGDTECGESVWDFELESLYGDVFVYDKDRNLSLRYDIWVVDLDAPING